jgi:cytochrome c oxidase assembly protein subunit 15
VTVSDLEKSVPASRWARLRSRFPRVRPGWVRPVLLANLVAEVGIVVTGGIVRVTGSGLGCPTWPECVPGSITPTAEQEEGIHKLIEYGNRTLSGVLLVLALLSLWVALTGFAGRRRMRLLAIGIVVGVLAQVIAGGITVLTGLHPITVAFHFVMSMVLIALSTALLRGSRDAVEGPGELVVHPLAGRLAWGTFAMGSVVLVLGTVVTGSGPHSGDVDTLVRTGFDARFVSWMHADAVMFFTGLVIATLAAVWMSTDSRESGRARDAWKAVLLVTLLQGVIGYVQYFTALPEFLVILHMLGASLLVVALTYGVLEMRRNPV